MKGQLIFDLPDEQEEFETHLKAQSFKAVLIDLNHFLEENRLNHLSDNTGVVLAEISMHLEELLFNQRISIKD